MPSATTAQPPRLKPQGLLLLLALLLSACVQTPAQDEPQPTESPAAELRSLSLSRCDELDYYYPVDASKHRPPGLQVKTIDPQRRLTNEIVNAMACSGGTMGERSLIAPRAWFLMLSVEPHATLRLSNISSYVWMVDLVAPQGELRDFFAPSLQARNGSVALSFQTLGSSPKARGDLEVRPVSGGVIQVQSTMVGTPASGSAGAMAAYTGTTEEELRLFRIDFSAYQYYSRGAASTNRGALDAGSTQPVPAYHNLGYDVRFTPIQDITQA